MQFNEVEQFAAYLRMLKQRSGRGFERLGQQAGVSSSSLHRYCSGNSIPPDYRVVHSFAKACGASAEELRTLHRLWAVADTSREALVTAGVQTRDTAAGGPSGPPAAVVPGEPPPVIAAVPVAGPLPETGPGPDPEPPARPTRAAVSRRVLAVALIVAAIALFGDWVLPHLLPAPEGSRPDSRPLFAEGCADVRMGEHDECVHEVQTLLTRVGGHLSVDSDFGPETLRRVTAFQVLAGLQPSGVVNSSTKRALYEGRVRMDSWDTQQVEARVRAVFREDPDHAVAIARCQSYLDPLHLTVNTNGTRNWGVFQISDARLQEYGGTPRTAFDPAWNIEVAHRLWSVDRDFHDWPYCDAAYPKGGAAATPSGRP